MTDRPLTERQRRFAELYAGDATRAAELAGYSGTKASLATIGSRLYADPRVRALIDARRRSAQPLSATQAPPDDPTPPGPTSTAPEGAGEDVDPVQVLRGVAKDPTALDSSKVTAAKALIAHQREQHEDPADREDRLRAKVAELGRKRRERERETGCCSRCGQPLRRRT